MRIRKLIYKPKSQKSDSTWSAGDLPPRHAPIYSRSRPIRAGWKWRSAEADADDDKFILIVLCNPPRDNWQAMLIVETGSGPSVVGRFEYHGSHPGIHGHAHCGRGGIEVGASSVDNLTRVPKARRYHRRTNAWTEETFWNAAKRFFRIKDDIGPLFNHAR
jgi:hypothetical protein